MKKITTLVFGMLYLLTSSVLFHAQSMNIVIAQEGPCDCAMNNHDTHKDVNNTCFETCFGTYDEFSSSFIEEKIIHTGASIFEWSLVDNIGVGYIIFDIATYRQLIDSGGHIDPGFPTNYIKVTKRLE